MSRVLSLTRVFEAFKSFRKTAGIFITACFVIHSIVMTHYIWSPSILKYDTAQGEFALA